MELKKLKQLIDIGSTPKMCLIFISDDNFLFNQYLNEIIKIKQLKPLYVDDLKIIDESNVDIFNQNSVNSYLYIYKNDNFKSNNKKLLSKDNIIILTKDITDEETKNLFENNIINLPKISNWQIKDYAYSKLEGLKPENIDWLLNNCKYDLFRLDNEIDKLNLFKDKNKAFKTFCDENIFSDLTDLTIFNFTDALITKNKTKLIDIFKNIKNIDINEIGFTNILYNNFKNIINIQLNPSATAQSLGMNPKQFIAIKYKTGYYNQDQLIATFKELCGIDLKLKTGSLPVSNIIDYLIIKILG